jgi:hypothetical protein
MPSTNPHVGTWKMNHAKSTFSAGPAFKGSTAIIEAAGEGVKVVANTVQGDGSMTHWQYTADCDGEEYPVTGNPNFDRVAVTIDATTIQSIFKKGGNVTTTLTSVLSDDGKTRTVTAKGINAAGQTLNAVLVFDRQ